MILGEKPRKLVLPEPPPPDDPVAFLEWAFARGDEKDYESTMCNVWSPKNCNAQICGYVPKECKP